MASTTSNDSDKGNMSTADAAVNPDARDKLTKILSERGACGVARIPLT